MRTINFVCRRAASTIAGNLTLLITKRFYLDIVRSHHIYMTMGYPNSLNKKASNLAQIVTISDAFEAMCSKRVYSEGKTLEEARKELIKEQGTQFNPDLIDVFLEKAAEFYPVTQVKRVFKKEDSK